MRAPRVWRSAPSAPYSAALPPTPMPRRTCPPLRTSRGGRLFRKQDRLPGGRDDDGWDQFYRLRHGGHVGQYHHRLVQVSAPGAQHLVGDAEVRVPQVLRGLGESLDGCQVILHFPNWKRYSDLHAVLALAAVARQCTAIPSPTAAVS